MRINFPFILMLTILLSLGSWGLWNVASDNSITQNTSNALSTETVTNNAHQAAAIKTPHKTQSNEFNNHSNHVTALLKNNNSDAAIAYINAQYSVLSSEQLDQFKSLLINVGLQLSDKGELKKAQRLFTSLSILFDDIEVWDLLSHVSSQLKDWPEALDSLLKSSLIENDSERLISKRSSLTLIAAQLKKYYQSLNDLVSVRDIYQRLYNAHPGYAYFELELALAELALNNTDNAKSHLNAILYDLDVGSVAQGHLATLEQIEAEQQQAAAQKKENNNPARTPTKNNDISVPLIRVGNSFLVDSSINGKQSRLLLDTGASITALSPELIAQLKLPETGEVIRLSTANGVTESRLFLAKKISIGRISVRDLVVAEIQLGSTRQFHGLLGTDLLNKVSDNYHYLIDNQNNALIFRASQ